ncbi:MAG: DNA polymerase III subunit delta', partial [Desulfovibrio sp.]|nr:DNA polymerase III subunit delta' [Desulfovibrio sp.]
MRANVVKAGVPEALANKALTIYRERLQKLALSPPQVLLIEGGNENDRRTFARYWACCLLCSAKNGNAPCLSCQECQRILDDIHLDILAYDGAITKTQDEENPSFFRALITDNARALKGQVHNEPNGPYRIVYLTGIAQSRVEAPNALLKVLEDPIPSTRFVIMVPQREQILQTLVSRSLCFTLPWTYEEDLDDAEIRKLTTGLALFFSDNENFLATITTKNALPTPLAQQLIVA